MNKELISDRQSINLLIVFMFGSTLIMGTGGSAKNDMWIAIIIGIVFTIPVMLIYSRLLAAYPGKDIFDILNIVFGRTLGKAISIFYIWFPFHLGALVLRNFGEFINTVALPETPKIVPMILFAGLSAWVAKQGIETLSKCASFFIVIVIILLVLFTFLTIPQLDSENLLPMLGSGISPVLRGALEAFSFPFGETVIFIAILSSLKAGKSPYRVYMIGLMIAGFFIVVTAVRNTMVLGPEISNVYFPAYSVVSRINIGNFFQRTEIAVSMVFILSGFVKISVCLIAACKGFAKLLGFDDYRFVVIPIALLMVNLSYTIYENIMEMFEWAFDVWPYYALLFQVFLPLILFIAVEIKLRSQKSQRK